MIINKRNVLAAICIASISTASLAAPVLSGPFQIKAPVASQKLNTNKLRQNIVLKPDLIVQSAGFSQEFCTSTCSDTWKRELRVSRIDTPNCSWQVEVRNIGASASRAGQVQVTYQSIAGPVRLTTNMPALRSGETKQVVVRLSGVRPAQRYWKLGTSLQTKVDSTNTNAESNERNNTKDVRAY